MNYGDKIKLFETESLPVLVEMVGNSIHLLDHADEIQLTEKQARQLMEILQNHFNK